MAKLKKLLSWSNLSLIIIFSILAFKTLDLKLYNNPRKIIESDVGNYYAYLPLTFIFDQLDYKFDGPTFKIIKPYLYSAPVDNGKRINPTTMGMSIAYSPFFFAAHFSLKALGRPATGFSEAYRLAILFACLFYVILSLFLLKKILLKIFGDPATALALTTLVLATNLFYYMIFEPGMTHAFNFSFGVFFLYFTIKWHEKPGILNSVGAGFFTGLIALIRPTDIIIILIFILWKVRSFSTLKYNMLLFFKNWYLILIIIVSAILVWVPQMIYWHHFTDHYFYNPYKGMGFRFFFNNPQFLITLFSYRKGWLLYTPVMLMIFPGFVFLYRKYRDYFWPVLIYFIFNVWIISSWCLPWYGGSYGHRAFIASYGIMIIPIAALYSAIFSKKKILNLVTGVLIAFIFIYHNFFQLQQYKYGAIHFVSMTKEAYWDSFGHKHPSKRFGYLLAFPNYDSAKAGIYPKDKINPLYTEDQHYDTALIIITRHYFEDLQKDSVYRKQLAKEALTNNIGLDDLVKSKAKQKLDQMISDKIITIKKVH